MKLNLLAHRMALGEVDRMKDAKGRRLALNKNDPFPFVLDELLVIRPRIRRMFGFTHVYLDEKLLCSLRNSQKQPATNGMWLYTSTENLESLAREFPQLPKRQLWRSGKNAWVVLASRLADFEEHALKACELMLNGDRRIGRVTRGRSSAASHMREDNISTVNRLLSK